LNINSECLAHIARSLANYLELTQLIVKSLVSHCEEYFMIYWNDHWSLMCVVQGTSYINPAYSCLS